MLKRKMSTILAAAAMSLTASFATADVISVIVTDFDFLPPHVGVNAGDTVEWDWLAEIPHSTTSAAGFAESWDSGIQGYPFTFAYDFTVPGIYPYYCTLHGSDNGDGTVSGMAGHVSVFSGDGFELLQPVPGTAGLNNVFSAGNASPGSSIYFIYGLQQGSTQVPVCMNVFLDLANPQIIDNTTADASGFAAIEVFVPNAASGVTVHFQAFSLADCAVSNLVTTTF